MKLSDITVMPPIVGLNVQERELWELAFSDNTRPLVETKIWSLDNLME